MSLNGATGQYQFFISNSGGINSGDSFGIKKVVVYQTVGSDNSDIIDNNNQNTTDIINNSNSNTQDIISAINNGMTDLCTNLLEPFNTYARPGVNTFIPDVNGITASASSSWSYVQYRLPVAISTKYYFNGTFTTLNQLGLAVRLSYGDLGQYFYEFTPTQFPRQSWDYEFISSLDGYVNVYLFITNDSSNNAIFYEMMFSSKSKTFCPFGSNISKLDEQTKAIEKLQEIMNEIGFTADDTNAYLKDDTNPNVPTSDIEDTLDLVEINNPLGYLLTLPISLIQKINNALSQDCSDFTLGRFGTIGSNNLGTYEFKFPCLHPEQQLGSTLWGVIDTLVAIGLLAITVYKIYQGVINILTLGGEQEVSGQFVYWTPMEFLAIICGGDSVAVFQRRSNK